MTARFGCAASSLITGSASAQNIVTLENPSDSTVILRVRSFGLRGSYGGVLAAGTFLFRIGRTTGMPSSGTTQTATYFDTLSESPQAIVRAAPTVTIDNTLWSYPQGSVLSVAGVFQPGIGEPPVGQDLDLILRPGEALVGVADANATGWKHNFCVSWTEEA